MRITKGQSSLVQRADNAIKRPNRQISVKKAYFFVVIVLLSFFFFFATQECLNYENLIFAVSLRKTSSVVTLTWNLIRQQMKTRNQNKMKVRTISTLVCCVGVFQWGKAGTYSNLQNSAKFCGTQLNPYYQGGGGSVRYTKEGRKGMD